MLTRSTSLLPRGSRQHQPGPARRLPEVLHRSAAEPPDELLPRRPYPSPENDFRIAAGPNAAEPDLRLAALSRAADLAMVNYDANAPIPSGCKAGSCTTVSPLQGAFGAPYEFLWANPTSRGSASTTSLWPTTTRSGETCSSPFGLGGFGGLVRLFRRGGAEV